MAYSNPLTWNDNDPTTALTAARFNQQISSLAGYTDTVAAPKALVDAKGDLLVGSANDTLVRLPVGANDSVLTASSTTASGVSWVPKTVFNAGDPTYSLPTNGTSNAATAINTAGAVAAFDGGGVVVVPRGTYTLTTAILHNYNARVYWDFRGCKFLLSGAATIGLDFNPGTIGEAGLGGGALGGQFVTSASGQTGVRFRNANGFSLAQTRIEGPSGTGLDFVNDGGGKYNEKHTLTDIYATGMTNGITWRAINGGDPSMEGQTFRNVWVGGSTIGWTVGAGVNMESVHMSNCMVQAAGKDNATCIKTNGDLKGWRGTVICEHLTPGGAGTAKNCVVFNADAGTTSENLMELDIHVLPQTASANSNSTWAAAPYIKHATVAQPPITRDGNIYRMQGAIGGYVRRVRRDFEGTDRMRESYAGFQHGPGTGAALDCSFFRKGAAAYTTVAAETPFGCSLELSGATAANEAPIAAQVSGLINHGSTASTARPSGFGNVTWVGSVTPTNAINGDLWIDVS